MFHASAMAGDGLERRSVQLEVGFRAADQVARNPEARHRERGVRVSPLLVMPYFIRPPHRLGRASPRALRSTHRLRPDPIPWYWGTAQCNEENALRAEAAKLLIC